MGSSSTCVHRPERAASARSAAEGLDVGKVGPWTCKSRQRERNCSLTITEPDLGSSWPFSILMRAFLTPGSPVHERLGWTAQASSFRRLLHLSHTRDELQQRRADSEAHHGRLRARRYPARRLSPSSGNGLAALRSVGVRHERAAHFAGGASLIFAFAFDSLIVLPYSSWHKNTSPYALTSASGPSVDSAAQPTSRPTKPTPTMRWRREGLSIRNMPLITSKS